MAAYLDHNATTPLHQDVLESMMPYMREHYGNASSMHEKGRRARQAIEEARESVALLIGCRPEEIIFTGSGTEANNIAIRGAARALREKGARIVISAVEHHSVLRCAESLQEDGFELRKAGVDGNGRVSPDSLRECIDEGTILVSIMHANNEIGTIQPIYELRRTLSEDILFHTDAIQAAGKMMIDVRELGVDLLSLSAHKIGGPKGVGALFRKRGIRVKPIMFGGAQEEGYRPGTYDVAGIVGFGAAAGRARLQLPEGPAYAGSLRDRLEDGIRKLAPDATILVDRCHRLANTVTICFPRMHNMIDNLDTRGIEVSSGAACSSGSNETSHVLSAIGIDPMLARSAVRFSFGETNSESDVENTLSALRELLKKRDCAVSRGSALL